MNSYLEFVEQLFIRGIISKETYEKALKEGKQWF